jgi:hypothetical protein
VHETNQDQSIFYDGTYSYSNDANAGYDFYLDDCAQSFSIWGGKKQDRCARLSSSLRDHR